MNLRNKKKYFFTSIFFVLLFSTVGAQYFPNYTIPVNHGSKNLSLAWTGGLNNPQLSAADLNNDGIDDLVIFDRAGNKFLTFINKHISDSVCYTYAPKYELNFPEITDWALLVDFNCDGIEDIFAHASVGIGVYKGYYNSGNELCFSLFKDPLRFVTTKPPYPNLYVSSVDIPAIDDIDNDGDLDIVTFEILGGYIEYYKNFSKENGYNCDSLIFKLEEHCYGDIYEPSDTPAKKLNVVCPYRFEEEFEIPRLRHSGSTLLSFDSDGDGDKELVIGDIGFNDLVFLLNGGSVTDAHFVSQDILFPEYSVPVNLPNFPASFYLDLNNDGLKDLVASPNFQYGSENIANVWYYKNAGTASNVFFEFQTDSLFTRDMIEVGEGSFGIFADLDNDSLQDLIISNWNYYDDYSYLAFYKNTGSKESPAFTLETRDYMNLSSLHLNALHPSFGDLDGDGDLDMVAGISNGTLLFFRNIAASGSPANFVLIDPEYFNINVGTYSTPQLVDANEDGKLDLLIGNQEGTLYYYQNSGSVSSPDFSTVTNNNFGEVSVAQFFSIYGQSVPYLTKLNGSNSHTLLVGCDGGTIFQYDNIDGNLNGKFNLVDSVFSGIKTGGLSSISGSDINGDGIPELVVGNIRGGLSLYDTARIHALIVPEIHSSIIIPEVYPNPSDGKFILHFTDQNLLLISEIEITNLLGQKISFTIDKKGKDKFLVEIKNAVSGIYFCKIVSGEERAVCKILIEK